MFLFRKVDTPTKSVVEMELRENVGDSFLDGKIPLKRLKIEEELEGSMSLSEYIRRQKESEDQEV